MGYIGKAGGSKHRFSVALSKLGFLGGAKNLILGLLFRLLWTLDMYFHDEYSGEIITIEVFMVPYSAF